MHLVGFIIIIYQNARSPESQNQIECQRLLNKKASREALSNAKFILVPAAVYCF